MTRRRLRIAASWAAFVAAMGILGGAVLANVRFYRSVVAPPRESTASVVPVLIRAEPATFETSDGITLQGTFFGKDRVAPAIVFCHDRGQDRGAVLRLAMLHNRLGFAVLAFDFRAHGDSGGERSTLGIKERLDVVAAARYAASRADVLPGKIGLWGIGMGAFAALRAAPEVKDVTAVALCYLYRDPRDILRSEYERTFHSGMGLLEDPYLDAFQQLAGEPVDGALPEHHIARIADLQVLMVVADDDPRSRDYVVDSLYTALDSYHRSLLKLSRTGIPSEGTDTQLFESNTIRFFQDALMGSRK